MSYLQEAKNDQHHKLPTAFARLFYDADEEICRLKDEIRELKTPTKRQHIKPRIMA